MSQYVQSEFQKAKTLNDIFKISKKLKSEGIDVQTVNKYATLAKMSIAQKHTSYDVIPKERIRKSELDEDYTSQLNVTANHLSDCIIEVDGDNYII